MRRVTVRAIMGVLMLAGLGLLKSVVVKANDRPNFVFFLVDDLRFDATGVTGHPFGLTPNIDRVANEGLRFTNAFVTTSLCSPSRASCPCKNDPAASDPWKKLKKW